MPRLIEYVFSVTQGEDTHRETVTERNGDSAAWERITDQYPDAEIDLLTKHESDLNDGY